MEIRDTMCAQDVDEETVYGSTCYLGTFGDGVVRRGSSVYLLLY